VKNPVKLWDKNPIYVKVIDLRLIHHREVSWGYETIKRLCALAHGTLLACPTFEED